MNDEYNIQSLDDDALIKLFNQAKDDLKQASDEEPESAWHEACFAAVMMCAMEAQSRGIKLATVH